MDKKISIVTLASIFAVWVVASFAATAIFEARTLEDFLVETVRLLFFSLTLYIWRE